MQSNKTTNLRNRPEAVKYTDKYAGRGNSQLTSMFDYLKNDPASYFYNRMKGKNPYLRDDFWTEAAQRGDSGYLTNLLQQASEEDFDSKAFDLLKGYEDKIDYDAYMLALEIPHLDNETKKDRMVPGSEHSFGSMTDREWAEFVLNENIARWDAEILENIKQTKNWATKIARNYFIGGYAKSWQVVAGVVKGAGELANLGVGAFHAIIEGNMFDPKTLGQAFLKTYQDDETGLMAVSEWINAVSYEIQRTYSTSSVNAVKAHDQGWRPGSGNFFERANQGATAGYTEGAEYGVDWRYGDNVGAGYTGWGSISNSMLNGIGSMIPVMAISGGLAGANLVGPVGKAANVLKSNLFYASIFSGGVQSKVTQLNRKGISYKDMDAGAVITNALAKAAFAKGLDFVVGQLLGHTAVDRLLHVGETSGKLGKAQGAKLAKGISGTTGQAAAIYGATLGIDAVKLGAKSALKETAGFFIDELYDHLWLKSKPDQQYNTEITPLGLTKTFLTSALTSLVVGAFKDAQGHLMKEDRAQGVDKEGRVYKLGYFQSLNYEQARLVVMDWINEINKDYGGKEPTPAQIQKKVDAILGIEALTNTVGDVFRYYGFDKLEIDEQMLTEALTSEKAIGLSADDQLKINIVKGYANNLYKAFTNIQSARVGSTGPGWDSKETVKKATEEVATKLLENKVTEFTTAITPDVDKNDPVVKDIPVENLTKWQQTLNTLGVEAIVGIDSNVVIKSEDVIFAPTDLIKNGDLPNIVKGVAYDVSVDTVIANLNKNQRNLIQKAYRDLTGLEDGSLEDATIALLFDKKFYTYTLLKSVENKYQRDAFETLATIDKLIRAQATPRIKNGSLSDKAYKTLMKKVQTTMRAGLVTLATNHNKVDLGVIDNAVLPIELKQEITNHQNVIFTNLVDSGVKNVVVTGEMAIKRVKDYNRHVDKYAAMITAEEIQGLKDKAASTNINDIRDAHMALVYLAKVHPQVTDSRLTYLPAFGGDSDVLTADVVFRVENIIGTDIKSFIDGNFEVTEISKEMLEFMATGNYLIEHKDHRIAAARYVMFYQSNKTLSVNENGTILRVIEKEDFFKKEYLGTKGLKALDNKAFLNNKLTLQELARYTLPKEIGDIEIRLDASVSGLNGYYVSDTDTIVISGTDPLDAIMHEVTHVTQDLIKGDDNYIGGGNVDLFVELPKATRDSLSKYIQETFPATFDLMSSLTRSAEPEIMYFLLEGELQANSTKISALFDTGFTWRDNKNTLVSPDGKRTWDMTIKKSGIAKATGQITKKAKEIQKTEKPKPTLPKPPVKADTKKPVVKQVDTKPTLPKPTTKTIGKLPSKDTTKLTLNDIRKLNTDIPLTPAEVKKLNLNKEVQEFTKDSDFRNKDGSLKVIYRSALNEDTMRGYKLPWSKDLMGRHYLEDARQASEFAIRKDIGKVPLGVMQGFVLNVTNDEIYRVDGKNKLWSEIPFKGEELAPEDIIAHIQKENPKAVLAAFDNTHEINESWPAGTTYILLDDTRKMRVTIDDGGKFIKAWDELKPTLREEEREEEFNKLVETMTKEYGDDFKLDLTNYKPLSNKEVQDVPSDLETLEGNFLDDFDELVEKSTDPRLKELQEKHSYFEDIYRELKKIDTTEVTEFMDDYFEKLRDFVIVNNNIVDRWYETITKRYPNFHKEVADSYRKEGLKRELPIIMDTFLKVGSIEPFAKYFGTPEEQINALQKLYLSFHKEINDDLRLYTKIPLTPKQIEQRKKLFKDIEAKLIELGGVIPSARDIEKGYMIDPAADSLELDWGGDEGENDDLSWSELSKKLESQGAFIPKPYAHKEPKKPDNPLSKIISRLQNPELLKNLREQTIKSQQEDIAKGIVPAVVGPLRIKPRTTSMKVGPKFRIYIAGDKPFNKFDFRKTNEGIHGSRNSDLKFGKTYTPHLTEVSSNRPELKILGMPVDFNNWTTIHEGEYSFVDYLVDKEIVAATDILSLNLETDELDQLTPDSIADLYTMLGKTYDMIKYKNGYEHGESFILLNLENFYITKSLNRNTRTGDVTSQNLIVENTNYIGLPEGVRAQNPFNRKMMDRLRESEIGKEWNQRPIAERPYLMDKDGNIIVFLRGYEPDKHATEFHMIKDSLPPINSKLGEYFTPNMDTAREFGTALDAFIIPFVKSEIKIYDMTGANWAHLKPYYSEKDLQIYDDLLNSAKPFAAIIRTAEAFNLIGNTHLSDAILARMNDKEKAEWNTTLTRLKKEYPKALESNILGALVIASRWELGSNVESRYRTDELIPIAAMQGYKAILMNNVVEFGGYGAITNLIVIRGNRPIKITSHKRDINWDKIMNTPEARYISNKIAQESNLKYFIKKGQPVQLHPKVASFVSNTTKNFSKLPKVLRDKIQAGSLNYYDLVDYVSTAKTMNNFTFQSIAKYVYNNEELAQITFSETQDLIDKITDLAAISEVVTTPEVVRAPGQLLMLLQATNRKAQGDTELSKKLIKAYKHAERVKMGIEYVESTPDPKQLVPIFMRHYKGTLTSLRHINNFGKLLVAKQQALQLDEKVDTEQYKAEGGAWNWIDRMRRGDIDYEKDEDMVDSLQDIDREDKIEAIENYIADEMIKKINKMSKQEKEAQAETLQKQFRDAVGNLDTISDEELNKKYLATLANELSEDKDKVLDPILAMKDQPRSTKNIKDHLRQAARTVSTRIAGLKRRYNQLAPEVQAVIDPKTYKMTAEKYSKLSDAELETLLEYMKDAAKQLNTTIKAEEVKKAEKIKSEERLAKLAEKVEKKKTPKQGTLREKINVIHKTKVINQKFTFDSREEITSSAQQMLNTQWGKTTESQVQGLTNNTTQNVHNGEVFFKENADVLIAMTTGDAEATVKWFMSANIQNAEIDSREAQSFAAVRLYFLGFVYGEAQLGGQFHNFSKPLRNRLENYLKTQATVAGTSLSVWKNIRQLLNPYDIMREADMELGGVLLTDDEKDVLFDAAEKGDIASVMQAQELILNRVMNEKTSKRSVYRKITTLRSMFMLSSPISWLRYKISKPLLNRLNTWSTKISSKLLSSKGYDPSQFKLDQPITPKIQTFINDHFIDNGLFDQIVSNLSRYNPSSIQSRYKSNKPSKDTIFSNMVIKSMYNKYYNQNMFDNPRLNKLHQGLMKIMSDNNHVREASIRYFGRILAERGYGLETGVTDAIMNDFATAVGLAMADYMHSNNFFNSLESMLAARSEAALFTFKLFMPFASTSWNWFKKAVKYSPIGLGKTIVDLAKLEKRIHDAEDKWAKGNSQIPPEFTEFFIRRDLGSGIIGTVAFIFGMILAGLGFIDLEEDDYGIPRLRIGDVRINVSTIFGTTSVLAGAALVGGWRDGDYMEALDAMLDPLLDNFFMTQILEMDKYNRGGWATFTQSFFENTLLSFIPSGVRWISGATYSGTYKPNNFFQKAVSRIPFFGSVFKVPKKVDPHTGKEGNMWDAFNRTIPYLEIRQISSLQDKAKGLGISKVELRGQYEINGEAFNLSGREVAELNKAYGEWNAMMLKMFYNNEIRRRVQMPNGTYRELSYNEMSDEQRSRAVRSIYEKNAEYAKIQAWLQAGNIYYASETDYVELRRRGVKGILYKGNRGFVKKSK